MMAETVANIAAVALIAAAFAAITFAAIAKNIQERDLVLRPIPVRVRSRNDSRDRG